MVEIPLDNDNFFCMDSTEVTNAQYKDFLDSMPTLEGQVQGCAWNDSYKPDTWPVPAGKDEHPVIQVDWCDAAAYCSWAGKELCGSLGEGELAFDKSNDPDYSQWANACSAGGTQTYPYGNELISDACSDSNKALGVYWWDNNVYGGKGVREQSCCRGPIDNLYGLGGNVAEWIAACNGKQGPNDTCTTIGYGSCGTIKNHPRNTKQLIIDPVVGFRCCATPQ